MSARIILRFPSPQPRAHSNSLYGVQGLSSWVLCTVRVLCGTNLRIAANHKSCAIPRFKPRNNNASQQRSRLLSQKSPESRRIKHGSCIGMLLAEALARRNTIEPEIPPTPERSALRALSSVCSRRCSPTARNGTKGARVSGLGAALLAWLAWLFRQTYCASWVYSWKKPEGLWSTYVYAVGKLR